jgi:hypothetical protein
MRLDRAERLEDTIRRRPRACPAPRSGPQSQTALGAQCS